MRYLFLFFSFMFFLADQARAVSPGEGRWDVNDHVSVRLISAVEAVGHLDSLPLGLEFQLRPDWKIYWRRPGDAGLPPVPDWRGSGNVEKIQFNWPLPLRFSVLGLETLGYRREVIFPLQVTPQTPGKPVHLKGDIAYLACSEICIPYTARIDLKLDAGKAFGSRQAYRIDSYRARVPRSGGRSAGGLRIDALYQAAEGTDYRLELIASADREIRQPDLFVEGADGLFFDAPVIRYETNRQRVHMVLRGGGVPVADFLGKPLTLTLSDEAGMLEEIRTPDPSPDGAAYSQPPDPPGILTFFSLALIGGLILNLMPCVLPVLSLKLLMVVGHGGGKAAFVRIGFVLSAAGIITAFLLLALMLFLMKSAGLAVGWGIQFQQPLFLTAMVMIMTLFAANMLGWFEFILPRFLADRLGRGGVRESLAGHFATGIFATLLATPCSAPFLGTAVGFALLRGGGEIFMIFAALGVGMSLPYLLVALFPALATRLPRPGPWMLKLKAILALALLITAGWLITVLAVQIGWQNALIVSAFGGLLLAVYGVRRLPQSRLGAKAGKISMIIVIAALLVPLVKPDDTGRQAGLDSTTSGWQNFDQKALIRYLDQGRIVFVDVTADWCITCKFNKKTVLDSAEFTSWLGQKDVVAMRADWTRPDSKIASYLADFGRYGIPFNAVYGPENQAGIALPELLSMDDVISASKKVSENPDRINK